MKKPIALLLSFLAVGAGGCGNDDESGERGARTSERPTDTGAGRGAKAKATVEVGMKNIQFAPRAVTISVGDTVKWTNTDSVTHTVTKQTGPGPEFDSRNMKVGSTFEHKFDRPGEVAYICTIHPNQTGTVTVE